MALTPGARLGSYEVLSALGAGGMGEVYRARDTRLHRDVAIKVLPDDIEGGALERFEREARAASSLTHPHICAVYDVGEAAGRSFLVMELVEGTTLRDYAAAKPLDSAVVIAIGAQIADALEAAHAKSIVHRDIKPGNIMVTGRRHVKVLDFGLARHVAADHIDETRMVTAAGTIVGTPHYMSPEVLQGTPADARSDIWALGVVLYELTAGRLPFQGPTASAVSSAILRDAASPLPADMPSSLRAVVARCLEKRPEDRYQDAGEVRAALEDLQTKTAPASPFRTWAAWAAAAVAVAALAVAAWIFVRPGGGTAEKAHKQRRAGLGESRGQRRFRARHAVRQDSERSCAKHGDARAGDCAGSAFRGGAPISRVQLHPGASERASRTIQTRCTRPRRNCGGHPRRIPRSKAFPPRSRHCI